MSDNGKTQRSLRGQVVSDKMNKTIVVRIERQQQHRLLGKILRRSSKLHVHDENAEAHEGDFVRIVECRPLSKTKHHRLVEVIDRAQK